MIGIVADDLTSAADGAGPFVGIGLSAEVGRNGFVPDGASEVIAVDTASRSLPAGEAGAATAKAVAALASSEILFKTVDSTLRGHVREEIHAAYRAAGRGRVVIAPAFPPAGRTTRHGEQLVDGIPVSASAYGRDPVHPARTARIADLVHSDLRHAAIVDAQSQGDLDRYVTGHPDPKDTLWVGSPGLAHALARLFAGDRPPAPPPADPAGPVLVVVGSANRISRDQIAALAGADDVVCLSSPDEPEDDAAGVLDRLALAAARHLGTQRFAALIATGGDTMAAVLDTLKVRSFALSGELEPGFPFAVATVGGRPLAIAMKAGGFGGPTTLVDAARRFLPQQTADRGASA